MKGLVEKYVAPSGVCVRAGQRWVRSRPARPACEDWFVVETIELDANPHSVLAYGHSSDDPSDDDSTQFVETLLAEWKLEAECCAAEFCSGFPTGGTLYCPACVDPTPWERGPRDKCAHCGRALCADPRARMKHACFQKSGLVGRLRSRAATSRANAAALRRDGLAAEALLQEARASAYDLAAEDAEEVGGG